MGLSGGGPDQREEEWKTELRNPDAEERRRFLQRRPLVLRLAP